MSALDRVLRWKDGIFEFSRDSECILRIGLIETRHRVELPGGNSRWVQGGGSTPLERTRAAAARRRPRHGLGGQHAPAHNGLLSVARAPSRRGSASCRCARDHRGHGLVLPGDRSAAEKLFTRLGFAAAPYQSALGRFGEFWQNVYSWMIMRASNAPTRPPWQLRRTEFWISANEFIGRYHERGSAAANASRDHRPALRPITPSG